ncbi:alpha/beta hydrolase fold domain-containing protein [Streptomyces sp. NPDC085946]|uniref:alpha/beta hydrolase fold domain-containing protein n=1 Tax=Streptomyces sp. NPDC085946 TaxID=3365744 RepID=UPI0037D91B0B
MRRRRPCRRPRTARAARPAQALEECFDVVQWVGRSGEQQGWDAERISTGGSSAGGNLTLGVLELARRNGGPQVQACALFIPFVDASIPSETYTGKAFVNPALVRTVRDTYFTDESQLVDPLASPALGTVEGLSPLLVISAGLDSLRPHIEGYVAKATAGGVAVTYRCIEDVDYDFPLSNSRALRPQQREMTGLLCEHLLQRLA